MFIPGDRNLSFPAFWMKGRLCSVTGTCLIATSKSLSFVLAGGMFSKCSVEVLTLTLLLVGVCFVSFSSPESGMNIISPVAEVKSI